MSCSGNGTQFPGKAIRSLTSANLAELYCDVYEDCPAGCQCKNFSCQYSLSIDCQGQLGAHRMLDVHTLFQDLPHFVPDLKREDFHYNITLRNKNISRITFRHYLNKTRQLSITNCSLHSIDSVALQALVSVITSLDLRNNLLMTLPNEVESY